MRRRDACDRSAVGALLVILAWSAVIFAVLAVPVAALGLMHFPKFDLDLGLDAPTTGTTLAPRPAAQCRRFRTIRDAGYASYDATTRARTRADWAAAKPEIDQVLAQYEFVLQGARKDAPPQVKEDLREVAANGHYGRAVLGAAGSSAEFADHVTGDLFNGFGALMRVESKLGSACGRGFTFWPADYQEARP